VSLPADAGARERTGAALARLNEVLARLLGENGCPWDREQTPQSLAEYLIEECFELVDAIRAGNEADVREELGDLLFLLAFVSRLYARENDFLAEALEASADKMIRRHPHVFANERIANLKELMSNWERIKKAEKKETGGPRAVFSGLPRNLPPLTKAYRIHAKAAGAGFTWPEDEDVARQVEAEWLELVDAESRNDAAAVEHEFGDHLFSLVEYGRRRGIKAAASLDMAANRFLRRFEAMEALARERGLDFLSLDLDAKDDLWEEVKSREP
jgi:ATP diphosphatase